MTFAAIDYAGPVGMSMDLALLGNRALQVAVRRNLACFPSQAPIFGTKARRDVQWRLAVLYFIHGWSTREIARRYGLTRERCGQIITDWRIRAVNMGYIQDITPDDFDAAAIMAIRGDQPSEEPAPVPVLLPRRFEYNSYFATAK